MCVGPIDPGTRVNTGSEPLRGGEAMGVGAMAQRDRLNIGIVAGSGPEAGLDMWAEVLAANKRLFGAAYRGDLDAPNVTIISEPNLGLSMEMDRHAEVVWHYLKDVVDELSRRVAYFAIACNTLNCYCGRLATLGLRSRMVSFADVVESHIRRNDVRRVCLLGARPVADLGPWSPYRHLSRLVEVETPPDIDGLQTLIYDIKRGDPRGQDITARFQDILSRVESQVVLLACTELPLIRDVKTDKTLVDVTGLVAAELAGRSFAPEGDGDDAARA